METVRLQLWTIQFDGSIRLEGYVRNEDGTMQKACSEPICKRIGATVLFDISARFFELAGQIDREYQQKKGMPCRVIDEFTNGFPKNWRLLIKSCFGNESRSVMRPVQAAPREPLRQRNEPIVTLADETELNLRKNSDDTEAENNRKRREREEQAEKERQERYRADEMERERIAAEKKRQEEEDADYTFRAPQSLNGEPITPIRFIRGNGQRQGVTRSVFEKTPQTRQSGPLAASTPKAPPPPPPQQRLSNIENREPPPRVVAPPSPIRQPPAPQPPIREPQFANDDDLFAVPKIPPPKIPRGSAGNSGGNIDFLDENLRKNSDDSDSEHTRKRREREEQAERERQERYRTDEMERERIAAEKKRQEEEDADYTFRAPQSLNGEPITPIRFKRGNGQRQGVTRSVFEKTPQRGQSGPLAASTPLAPPPQPTRQRQSNIENREPPPRVAAPPSPVRHQPPAPQPPIREPQFANDDDLFAVPKIPPPKIPRGSAGNDGGNIDFLDEMDVLFDMVYIRKRVHDHSPDDMEYQRRQEDYYRPPDYYPDSRQDSKRYRPRENSSSSGRSASVRFADDYQRNRGNSRDPRDFRDPRDSFSRDPRFYYESNQRGGEPSKDRDTRKLNDILRQERELVARLQNNKPTTSNNTTTRRVRFTPEVDEMADEWKRENQPKEQPKRPKSQSQPKRRNQNVETSIASNRPRRACVTSPVFPKNIIWIKKDFDRLKRTIELKKPTGSEADWTEIARLLAKNGVDGEAVKLMAIKKLKWEEPVNTSSMNKSSTRGGGSKNTIMSLEQGVKKAMKIINRGTTIHEDDEEEESESEDENDSEDLEEN